MDFVNNYISIILYISCIYSFIQLQDNGASMNQANRRQLVKLQNMLTINENQYHSINNQIDGLWSQYQDKIKKSSR